MSRKHFNGDDAIFIPAGSKKVKDCIPAGKEHEYVDVGNGWIHKKDYEKMKLNK